MRYGCAFVRDPWTGHATLLHEERVPARLLKALKQRWGDVEAILNEQSPPTQVAVSRAEALLT
jgi:hypothetical protein